MSRILYGLSGDGFGHVSRSHEVAMHLRKQGHELLVLTYGRSLDVMRKDFTVIEVPGLHLNYQNNKVDFWKTFSDSAKILLKSTQRWRSIIKQIRAFKPDLVISDFEPVSAGYAHLDKKPLISFDNQHQLTNTSFTVPKKYTGDLRTGKLIVNSYVWGADYYFITTFFKTKISQPHSFLFPPVVRSAVRRLKPKLGKHILVYQNSAFDYVLPELKKLAPQPFIVYGARDAVIKDGNLTLKPHNQENFTRDLRDCRGIIATAGLSLISEAIWLDKPYFAIPVAKTIEQTLNALYLKKLGYGDYADIFTAAHGKKFLSKLAFYRKNLQKQPKEGTARLLKKFDAAIASLTAN